MNFPALFLSVYQQSHQRFLAVGQLPDIHNTFSFKKGKLPDRNQNQQNHPWIIGNRFRPGKSS